MKVTDLRKLAVPAFGVATLVQVLPFQCSIRVCWPVPWPDPPVQPTAHAFLEDSAATPVSSPPPAGTWRCCIVQCLPFQCSMSGVVADGMPGPGPTRPTAQALKGDVAAT